MAGPVVIGRSMEKEMEPGAYREALRSYIVTLATTPVSFIRDVAHWAPFGYEGFDDGPSGAKNGVADLLIIMARDAGEWVELTKFQDAGSLAMRGRLVIAACGPDEQGQHATVCIVAPEGMIESPEWAGVALPGVVMLGLIYGVPMHRAFTMEQRARMKIYAHSTPGRQT